MTSTPSTLKKRKKAKSVNRAALVEYSDTVKGMALAAYRKSAIVMDACAAVGIGRRTWYGWIKADPVFAAQVLE